MSSFDGILLSAVNTCSRTMVFRQPEPQSQITRSNPQATVTGAHIVSSVKPPEDPHSSAMDGTIPRSVATSRPPYSIFRAVAVMARYNPFAEKAGMKPIQVSEPTPSVLQAIDQLTGLGFSPAYLSSRNGNKEIINDFNEKDRIKLKNILLKLSGVYLRRLCRRSAYVNKTEFSDWFDEQDSSSLAWTLETLSTLAQSKAYLYWCRDWEAA